MEEKIIDLMKKVFKTDNISASTDQSYCENWDSLNHLNLIVELENEFGVEFEPEEIAEMKSVRNILSILSSKTM